MMWLPLTAICVVCSSVSTLIQRSLLKKQTHDPIVLSILFQFGAGVLILIVGFVLTGFDFSGIANVWNHYLILGFLYGFGHILVFKALQISDVSHFIVLFSLRAFVTIISAALILDQHLTLVQIAGAICIFFSVILITIKSSKIQLGIPELLALGAAICFGLASINDKILLSNQDIFTYLLIAFFLPAGMMTILYIRKLPNARTIVQSGDTRLFIIYCLLYTAGAIAFSAALQDVDIVSKVTTVNISNVILTVILSMVILKERQHIPKKMLAVCVCILGLFLVSI